MSGGVSHIDTFDYKPALAKYHGMPLEGKGEIRVRQGFPGPLMKSPYSFKQYGQSGIWASELFPHIGSIVDDLAFIYSCQGKSSDHVLSHYEWNTGSILMGFPSVGSWVTYGLGSENQNLPGFRGDLRRARRAILRAGQLERWLSAGGLPGNGLPFQRRPDPGSVTAVSVCDSGAGEGAAGSAQLDKSAARREASGQHGTGGPDCFLRAGLSHADVRARSRGHRNGERGNEAPLRAGQSGDRAVRQTVPAGHGGWSREVCASSSSTAGPSSIRTWIRGTPMPASWTTTACTPRKWTNPSPV